MNCVSQKEVIKISTTYCSETKVNLTTYVSYNKPNSLYLLCCKYEQILFFIYGRLNLQKSWTTFSDLGKSSLAYGNLPHTYGQAYKYAIFTKINI